MKIQLIRHSTLKIYLGNKKILVDPVLSHMGAIAPLPNVPNQNFNPLVKLPVNIDTIINCDAVLVTHTHRDHFDDAATKLLSKNIPIFCQPQDEIKIKSYGFINVYPINNSYTWDNITFNRTNGEHGHGELAVQMAPVSGFIISSNREPSVYIAGDTVWCNEVEKSIEKYTPEIVVCNCGAAQFSYGEPITMTPKDIKSLCYRFPSITVVAVHMESWNHCRVSRKDLKHYIKINNIDNNIFIPEDGELITF
ncbi:MBL fold metallo-hydrolase [Clostridium sp. P21]|uniref:MBL fold metallo-hydrolase n=1 Tax=Clostridium muellerianum TaxID=2716538 RepID=A0A7Y0EDU4_9CLOT|nr:MBL fold metallo-hydrolase [Clostridium muellerianum]